MKRPSRPLEIRTRLLSCSLGQLKHGRSVCLYVDQPKNRTHYGDPTARARATFFPIPPSAVIDWSSLGIHCPFPFEGDRARFSFHSPIDPNNGLWPKEHNSLFQSLGRDKKHQGRIYTSFFLGKGFIQFLSGGCDPNTGMDLPCVLTTFSSSAGKMPPRRRTSSSRHHQLNSSTQKAKRE